MKMPKLVFISEDGHKAQLFIDGKEVKGAKVINISAYAQEPVEHEIKYITALSGEGDGNIENCTCDNSEVAKIIIDGLHREKKE